MLVTAMYIGIAMVIITIIAWGYETWPAVKYIIETYSKQRKWYQHIYRFFVIIFKFIPVIIDLAITAALVKMLSFQGMAGGVLGLAMSNGISLIILFTMIKIKLNSEPKQGTP